MTVQKPGFVGATETSIKISYQPETLSSSSYAVQWKQPNESWERAKRKTISTLATAATPGDGPTEYEIPDLEPGTTYSIRLIKITIIAGGESQQANEEFGPELVVDTEQVGCTPGQKEGCGCIIS